MEQGTVLVATPSNSDFPRTVVIVLYSSEEKIIGASLTRKWLPQPRFLPDSMAIDGRSEVYWGGPVSSPVFALHAVTKIGGQQILPDLFLTDRRKALSKLVTTCRHPYRLFVGRIEWDCESLDLELQRGDWTIATPTVEQFFADDLWTRLATNDENPTMRISRPRQIYVGEQTREYTPLNDR